MARLLAIMFGICLAACAAAEWPSGRLGQKAAWEAATDRVSQSRFIPMQLIVPRGWDGTRRIDMPVAEGFDSEGTAWSGPQEWRDPHTGRTVTVYDHKESRDESA